MESKNLNILISKYLDAKEVVLNQGYSHEVDWQDNLWLEDISERTFLREAAWVVLSSGMREVVIRKIFPLISASFFDWKSAKSIIEHEKFCRSSALHHFGHTGKINAILEIADLIITVGFDEVLRRIKNERLEYIRTFPYMGPATSFHFAKNIGLDVAKPDRHLLRIASILGYDCPQKLCSDISEITNEKTSVVDLVLWRFAVIDKDYLNFFKT